MNKTDLKNFDDYVMPLNMNGLQGRMLYLPPRRKNKEILLVYGHHSNLERWWGLAQELNKFGAVTMPDLPGFGGMQNFYKLGGRPNLDRFAAYLAAFIKLRYKRRRLTIIAIGFGFIIANRMLQNYPDIATRVDLIVGVDSIAHASDIKMKPSQRRLNSWLAFFLSSYLPSAVIRLLFFRSRLLKKIYSKPGSDSNYRKFEVLAIAAPVDLAVDLWRVCDMRTHIATIGELFKLDNCKSRLDVVAWHVGLNNQFVDRHAVEQHLKVIYDNLHFSEVRTSDLTLVGYRQAAKLIAPKLRRMLAAA